ncbi:MAG: dethiobiotin synthase [Actinomycetota bacterium]
MSAKILFVTGTDTEVGKTVVSGVLCVEALREGQTVRYCKPLQTGVTDDGQGADALAVTSFVKRFAAEAPVAPPLPVGEIEPTPSAFTAHELVRYPDPLAPAIAAAQIGRPIMRSRLIRQIRALAETCETLIVEGAGGLLVPISANDTMADLAADLEAPLVIVARPTLGTINHTMLTVNAAKERGLQLDRIVLTPWPEHPGSLEMTNLRWLRTATQLRVVTLPRV